MNPELRFLFMFWWLACALLTTPARGDIVVTTDPVTNIGYHTVTLHATFLVESELDNANPFWQFDFKIGPAGEPNGLTLMANFQEDVLPGVPIHFTYEIGLNDFTVGTLKPSTTYQCRFHAYNLPLPGSLNHNLLGDAVVFTTLPAPTVTTLPATNIGITSAVLHGEISGAPLTTPDRFGYVFAYGSTAEHLDGYVNATVDSMGFAPGGPLAIAGDSGKFAFPQFTTIHYCLRVTDPNSGDFFEGEDQVFTTIGNTPPLAPDAYGVIGSTETSVTIHSPATDPDSTAGEATSIVAVGDPAHGTVQIGGKGQWVVYTKGVDFTDTDTFTYTAMDAYGASTTGNIFMASPGHFFQTAAGTYETNVARVDGLPSGTLRLTLDATGAFSASMDFFGQTFSFTGAFHRDPNAGFPTGIVSIFDLPRLGLPPFEFQFSLYVQDGLPTFEGFINNLGSLYVAAAQTALLPQGSLIPEAGGYTAILPAVDDASLPQGHGFSRIVVKRNGSVKLAGKTGDGTPFTRGTRMRRDRSVLISAKLGRGNQDRLTGGVRFATAAETDCTGGFNWYRPQHPTGPYNSGFNYALHALGATFTAPPKGGAIFLFNDPVHPAVEFDLFDHAGAPLVASNVAVAPNGSTVTTYPSGEQLKINVDRHTGVFTGSLSTPDDRKHPRKFSGVIVQKQQRGAGVGGKSGEDGRVEFVAQ